MAGPPPKFWKPGAPKPGALVELERPVEGGEGAGSCLTYNTHINLSIAQQRQRLPIFNHRAHILYLVEKFRTVVIVGETGSGKTTQLPQYLHEAGWTASGFVVGVTQPRRVAATTVASRVADERGTPLGQEVGYCIRFDDCFNPEATRIKFLTDGMLVNEMMRDPLLNKYSVIILDEAHERTLYTDIIAGLLKKIMKKRDDLRLIVSSATLDAELFKSFFETNTTKDPSKDTSVILTVEGRTFDIETLYAKRPVPNYLKAAVDTALALHREGGPGDILVFLTGQEEVEKVTADLNEHAESTDKGMQLQVLPLFGGLAYSEQLKVFHRTPHNTRKVVVATNIAETSVTIGGIVYVIDCGFVKLRAFSSKTGLESLVVVPVSQSSAKQRAGRAGRVRAGKVYRLYTEEAFKTLPVANVPEMQRSNLAPVILHMKALGVDNVLRFHYLSAPPADNMLQGLELLYALNALDDKGNLTDPLGVRIAEFPLNPMFARMLLHSDQFGCSEEMLSITAMLQVQNIFVQPVRQRAAAVRSHMSTGGGGVIPFTQSGGSKETIHCYEGDHITLLNVYQGFMKFDKSTKWCQQNFVSYKGDPKPIQRCLVSGFFPNAARLHYTGTYRSVRGDHTLQVHPSSVLYEVRNPSWVVFNEVIQTSGHYMRDITVIEPEWLYELAPHFYEFGTERELAEAKRVKIG
eukprot:Em0018g1181a